MRRLLERLSLRWQLAMLYVASLSVVLTLLGLLLFREVSNILIASVYQQLQSNAAAILASGQLHAVTLAPEPDVTLFPHRGMRGPMPIFPAVPCPGKRIYPTPCGIRVIASPTAASPTPAGKPPDARLSLDRFVATDIVARFVDTRGDVREEAGSPQLLARIQPPNSEQVQLVAQLGRTIQYVQGSGADRVAFLLRPTTTPSGAAGVLVLAASLEQVDRFLALFRASLMIGIVAALGTGTALGLWATRRLLHPLDRITAVSRTVAAGDLRRRYDGWTGSNEVQTLAQSFNHMIDRLEATLQSQRQFTADAAHELRTPLTALGGSVELLLLGADEGDPRRTQKALRMMDMELQRLTRLVNDLLQLSRMEGQLHLEVAPLDIAALAADVASDLRIVGTNVTIETRIAGSLTVLADRDRLKQVLLNIGDNALKFTPPGGRIVISATRVGKSARLTVADSGPGIPADDLPHVFDRFYRGDPSRARSSGGMGLGLAIARAITVAHHGTISAESQTGQGAALTIGLPLMTVNGEPPPFMQIGRKRSPVPDADAVLVGSTPAGTDRR